MNTFKKELSKITKQNNQLQQKQLKTIGDDPASVIQYTLGTFISALDAMSDFVSMINCPQTKRDYITTAIFNIKAAFEEISYTLPDSSGN